MIGAKMGLVVVVIGLTSSCSPRFHLDPTGVTPQAKCGFKGSAEVTAREAKCIAKLSGLSGGVRPWKVERWRDDTPELTCWTVCNTLRPSRNGDSGTGECIDVRVSDGQVLDSSTWEGIRVE
jgi:hypothetical protein